MHKTDEVGINKHMQELYTCPKCQTKHNIRKIRSHCIKRCLMTDKEWYSYILGDKQESILKDFINNEINFQPLCKMYNVSPEWLSSFLFRYHKLKKRSISETRKTGGYKNGYRETCITNYGVENPSMSVEIKERKKDTFLKNFGYSNNFCNPDVQAKAQSRIDYSKASDSCKKTVNEKYGVNYVTQIESVKEKLRHSWERRKAEWAKGNFIDSQSIIYKSAKFVSKPEMRLQSAIRDIIAESDLKFNSWLEGVNVDILIQSKKIAIDFNGDFWHANPAKYCDSDTLYHDKFGSPVKAEQARQKDEKRVNKLNEHGYNVFVVWESDIKGKSDIEIVQILTDIIENNENSKNYKYQKVAKTTPI